MLVLRLGWVGVPLACEVAGGSDPDSMPLACFLVKDQNFDPVIGAEVIVALASGEGSAHGAAAGADEMSGFGGLEDEVVHVVLRFGGCAALFMVPIIRVYAG